MQNSPTSKLFGAQNFFDRDTVEANRQGRLTADQQKMLNSPIMGILGLFALGSQIAFIFFLPVFCVVGLIALNNMDAHSSVVLTFGALMTVISVGALVVLSVRFLRQRANVRADLAQEHVDHASGHLVYGKKGYEIEIPGQRLKIPWGKDRGGFAPGIDYRFYYLPTAMVLLSAEQITIMGEAQARDSLTEILIQANRFDFESLEVNRRGGMTQTQIPRLYSGLFWGLLFIFAPGSAVIYSFFLVRSSGISTAVLITVVMGLFSLIGVFLFGRAMIDIWQKRVMEVEGSGKKFTRTSSSSDSSSSTTYYYYRIGSERFKVHKRAYPALIDDINYRAYYTPRTKTLVNIEALDSPITD